MSMYQFSFVGLQVTPKLHADLQLTGLKKAALSSAHHKFFLLKSFCCGPRNDLHKAVPAAVEACLLKCRETNLHDPIIGATDPRKSWSDVDENMIFGKFEVPDMIEFAQLGASTYTFICVGTHLPVRTAPKQKQPVKKRQRRTASTESRRDTTDACTDNGEDNDNNDSATSQRTMDEDMDGVCKKLWIKFSPKQNFYVCSIDGVVALTKNYYGSPNVQTTQYRIGRDYFGNTAVAILNRSDGRSICNASTPSCFGGCASSSSSCPTTPHAGAAGITAAPSRGTSMPRSLSSPSASGSSSSSSSASSASHSGSPSSSGSSSSPSCGAQLPKTEATFDSLKTWCHEMEATWGVCTTVDATPIPSVSPPSPVVPATTDETKDKRLVLVFEAPRRVVRSLTNKFNNSGIRHRCGTNNGIWWGANAKS